MRHDELPLTSRIEAALKRIKNGHGQMRVPPEATDPDIVLSDALTHIRTLEALARRAGEALVKAHSALEEVMGDGGCYIPEGGEEEHARICPFCTINITLSALRIANLLPTRAEGGE